MRLRRAACFVVFLVSALPAAAQWREWDAEYDEEKKPWQEIQAQIPSYPKPENLVRVRTGSATSHQFFVDTGSVSLGEDGITRYTVVVKTSGGATNVTFEGMRCETREQKIYAIGHIDRTWARARDPKWQRVVLRDLTPHYHTLYHDFFCASGARPTPPREAVTALKRGSGIHNGRQTGD